MKFLFITIFLLFINFSYSLRCFTGFYGSNKSGTVDKYRSEYCASQFCRYVTSSNEIGNRFILGTCDTGNKCSENSVIDIVMTLENYYKHYGGDLNSISDEAKKSFVDVKEECCNSDNCNSVQKALIKTPKK
ncbi:Hypothetical protein SRAE_1000049500 [Strongyloides ratti]|uniref:Uncharacterized protein n=1 Tax=Strongyloides ratti TaxID=34506 RepID=A0A090L2B9_STRRB|nr:Hypothetical protein SRAE_1000049500 [Strongyloides ratti]CEF62222.1 Hypothetical protein SRAE_1000049500 [Strongyloides ratti]